MWSDKADRMDTNSEEADAAAAVSQRETFDSPDPNEFPLAKAFSEKPDSGFEVRLRFKKPKGTKKGLQWWYWPAACGLLAGLESYRPTARKEIIERQREWTFDEWIDREGTL